MERPGRMFVYDKRETVRSMTSARLRFGSFLKFPFGCVFS